ncbi:MULTISPECIES: gamma carbonic anhydrase family protein [Exiguobacterium]|uniref:gamma carbonic anhydrase family protein n=1 Tax=Exiguobacterium TaxID=33986 RepID=UPI001BEA3D3B|nr:MULTISPECIES: gamma carbonic anhydrase family protein [Exiguobacterium]MCT4783200.1 gamma carbonic anhydrase family protein [Exiguobacterium himgiriensis]
MQYKLGELFPNVDKTVFIAPGAHVIGDVTIGAHSGVWFNTVIRGDEGPIRIGSYVNIQDGSMVHQYEGSPTIIHDRVSIGHMAMIHGCEIEEGCLIGMHATVLDGAKVGKGSFVAAGALVTPNMQIPEGVMVMGVPAKVVRPLNDEDRFIMERTVKKYAKRAEQYLTTCEPIERKESL